jgi:hypothetical protein
MSRSPLASTRLVRSSANGGNSFSKSVLPAWKSGRVAGVRPAFLLSVVVAVKALACELPREHGLPAEGARN